MARESSNTVVESEPESPVAATDGQDDEELLRRFLESGDAGAEAAFTALMQRHGPMVLGVCRHVLGRHQDAEDAFQATFLVLARKAGSIRSRNVLARWLYEVAYRTAVRARVAAVRRQAYERQGAQMTAAASDDQDRGWDELRPVLHEELRRLPEKYRTPVVLCYLEGKTNEEAARLLQWPVGTVKGRLSRARDMLRSRLDRRGVSITLALLVFALSKNKGFAETLPEDLVSRTTRLAVSVKPPAAMVPPALARHLDRSLWASLATRRTSTVVLLVVIAIALTRVFNTIASGQGVDSGLGSAALEYWAERWELSVSSQLPAASCHTPVMPSR
ncbi:MAG: RNA polymerase sigma factor [Isosphaeraceae bacterium]|nr:RNA polymerase sigma factor [Isosphaeraceae bacterium]